MLIMAASLPVHRHRSMWRLLLIHLLLLVSQVVAFSWHGAYNSLPSSKGVAYSGWQPDTFWWRSRRRSPGPQASVGDWLGLNTQHRYQPPASVSQQGSQGDVLELDNSIPNMAQPAFAVPRLQRGREGWGFRRQQDPSSYRVSFHYSHPAFSSRSDMNRRNQLNMVKEELDEEVMKNVIREVLNKEQQRSVQSPVQAVKTPAEVPLQAETQVTTSSPSGRDQASSLLMPGPAEEQTLTRHSSRSSPEHSSQQNFADPSGFSEAFPAVHDSYSDFSSFGSFVDSADFSGGFGQPSLETPSHGNQGSSFLEGDVDHFEGGDHSALGFGGFRKADLAVGQFGWRDPQGMGDGQGGAAAEIKPIPTTIAELMGSFSQDDKDCDSILTKSCKDDLDCMCYGFYFCNSSGSCHDITASSSDAAAMTFGDKWHDGPAEKLGLTGRR